MKIEYPGYSFVIEDSPYSKYHIAEIDESNGDITSNVTMCLKDTSLMTSVGKEAIDSLVCSKCRKVYLSLRPQYPK